MVGLFRSFLSRRELLLENLAFRQRANFNEEVIDTAKSFGIQAERTNLRSPWQNGLHHGYDLAA